MSVLAPAKDRPIDNTTPSQSARRQWSNPLALVIVEARPVVQLIYVLRFAVGFALAAPDHFLSPRMCEGAVSWWLAVVAVYAFNGITDYAEDSANGSVRPIATGALARSTAGLICGIASLSSLAIAVQMRSTWQWVATDLILGVLYSARPFPAKNRTGTASTVVFGLGFCSYAAGAAAAQEPLHALGIVFAVVASSWMATAGTVLKDLSDVEGDAAGGRRTLAVRFGRRTALAVGVSGALLVGVCGCVAATLAAPRALVGTIPFAIGALILAAQSTGAAGANPADRWNQRRSYRVFMHTQYAANLAMLAGLLVGM